MNRLVRLYPSAWRERYEAEFVALLKERPPKAREGLDIIRGAIDARIHPQLLPDTAEPAGRAGGLRRAGGLATVGGVLWVLGSLAFYGAPYVGSLGYKDSGAANLIVSAAAALTGIAAAMLVSRTADRSVLLWGSAAAILLGAIGLMLPWPILLLGFFGIVLGTMLFGLVGTSVLGPAYLLVGVGALLALGFNTEDSRALLLVPLGLAWVVVGAATFKGAGIVHRQLGTEDGASHSAGSLRPSG